MSWYNEVTKYTETHNTLTQNQLGTRPGLQIHDAIYSLSTITYNYQRTKRPTYVAFLDYSTAFPAKLRVRGITLSTQNCAQTGSCPPGGLGHINKHNSESSTWRTTSRVLIRKLVTYSLVHHLFSP